MSRIPPFPRRQLLKLGVGAALAASSPFIAPSEANAVIDPGSETTWWPNAYDWVISTGTTSVLFSHYDSYFGVRCKYRYETNWTVGSSWARLNRITIRNYGNTMCFGSIVSQDGTPVTVAYQGQWYLDAGESRSFYPSRTYYASSGQRLTQQAIRGGYGSFTFTNGIQFKKW